MKKTIIILSAFALITFSACSSKGNNDAVDQSNVSDVIDNDTAIQNELNQGEDELKKMMEEDEAKKAEEALIDSENEPEK